MSESESESESQPRRLVGSRAILLSQLFKLVIQLGGLVILSRLVEPAEIGFVALQVTLVTFIDVLRDFGNTTRTLQVGVQNEYPLRENATVSMAFGLVGFAGYFLISLSLQRFDLSAEELAAVVIMGFTLIMNGLAAQSSIVLILRKRFSVVAVVESCAQAAGLIMAVIIVQSGSHLVALASQLLFVSGLAAFIKFALVPILPTRVGLKDIGAFLNQGRHIASAGLMNFWLYNLDNLIIQTRFGVHALGIYSRGFQIFMVPVAQLLWPMEKSIQVSSPRPDKEAEFSHFILQTQTKLQLYAVFAFTSLALLAPAVVPFLLGSNWAETVPLLQLLCLAGLIQVPALVTHWILILTSNNSTVFKASVLKVLLLAFCLLAFAWNLDLIPVAISCGWFGSWVISLWLAKRRVSYIPGLRLFLSAFRQIAVGVLTYVLVKVSLSAIGMQNSIENSYAYFSAACLTYAVLVYLLGGNSSREQLVAVCKYLKKKFRKAPSSAVN